MCHTPERVTMMRDRQGPRYSLLTAVMGSINELQEPEPNASSSLLLYPSISDIEGLDLELAPAEGRWESRELPIELRGSFQKNLIDAEVPIFDMVAPQSPREDSLPLSDSILPASSDLLRIQSPIMSDGSDIFHNPDLSGSDIERNGSPLPNRTPFEFVGTRYQEEMPLDLIWQEALFSTKFEENLSLAKIESATVNGINPGGIVENVNMLPNQNANCRSDVWSASLSVDIDDLLATLAECPLSAEEEPKVPSNVFTEKLDAQFARFARRIFVLEKPHEFKRSPEFQSVNVEERVSGHARSSPTLAASEPRAGKRQGRNAQSSPRHTPDRPNWALAPEDPPKPQTSSTRKAPRNQGRRAGRRMRQSRDVLKNEDSQSVNFIQSAPRSASPESCEWKPGNPAPGQRLSSITANTLIARGQTLQRSGVDVTVAVIRNFHTDRADTDVDVAVTPKDITQHKANRENEVLPESLRDQLRSSDSRSVSRGLLKQDPQTSSPYDSPRVSYTRSEFSAWLASLESSTDKPVVLYQSSPNTARLARPGLPASSAGRIASTVLKREKTLISGQPVQKPKISLPSVPNTSPKTLDRISWPSLEEEMRFHATERALSLAGNGKESSRQTVTEGVVSERIPGCQPLDEPGCLVPVSKIGHAVFVDSAGSGHGTTARVRLPPKISEKNAGSISASQAPEGALQVDTTILHANKIDSIHFDAFSWDAIHLPPLAGRGVSGRAGRGTHPGRFDPQRPLPPRLSLKHQAPQAHELAQHDIGLMYNHHRNIPGSRDNQFGTRPSPSSGNFVTPVMPTSVYYKPVFCSPANYLETGSALFPRDPPRVPSASVRLRSLQSNRSFKANVYSRNGEPGRRIVLENPSSFNGHTSVSQLQGVTAYEGGSELRNYHSHDKG